MRPGRMTLVSDHALGPTEPGVRISRRGSWAIPSVPDLIFLISAPVFALTGSALTQTDGDLAAHIRVGQYILATHRIPTTSLSSYTAPPGLANPAWLSQTLFAALYAVGGLALIACATAILAGTVHAAIAQFLRSRGIDARWVAASALISIGLTTIHWLARPHMFTIAGTVAVLLLLEAATPTAVGLCVVVFALWANLHGGWIYGLAMIALYVAGDAVGSFGERCPGAMDPRRVRLRRIMLFLAPLSVLVNPFGLRLYAQVLGTVSQSAIWTIDEYRAPDFSQSRNWLFLAVLAVSAALLVARVRRMPWRRVFVLFGSVAAALRSMRNIALFGTTGWPLLALHLGRSVTTPAAVRRLFSDFARTDRRARVGLWSAPMAFLLIALGLHGGIVLGRPWVPDEFALSRFPVQALRAAKQSGVFGRAFLEWTWSGYAQLVWPTLPLHTDPLSFSDETVRSYLRIYNVQTGWEKQLDRWRIELVVVPPRSRLSRALERGPYWLRCYSDATAVLFRRGGCGAGIPAAPGSASEPP